MQQIIAKQENAYKIQPVAKQIRKRRIIIYLLAVLWGENKVRRSPYIPTYKQGKGKAAKKVKRCARATGRAALRLREDTPLCYCSE